MYAFIEQTFSRCLTDVPGTIPGAGGSSDEQNGQGPCPNGIYILVEETDKRL